MAGLTKARPPPAAREQGSTLQLWEKRTCQCHTAVLTRATRLPPQDTGGAALAEMMRALEAARAESVALRARVAELESQPPGTTATGQAQQPGRGTQASPFHPVARALLCLQLDVSNLRTVFIRGCLRPSHVVSGMTWLESRMHGKVYC